jgi:hypothetical protein
MTFNERGDDLASDQIDQSTFAAEELKLILLRFGENLNCGSYHDLVTLACTHGYLRRILRNSFHFGNFASFMGKSGLIYLSVRKDNLRDLFGKLDLLSDDSMQKYLDDWFLRDFRYMRITKDADASKEGFIFFGKLFPLNELYSSLGDINILVESDQHEKRAPVLRIKLGDFGLRVHKDYHNYHTVPIYTSHGISPEAGFYEQNARGIKLRSKNQRHRSDFLPHFSRRRSVYYYDYRYGWSKAKVNQVINQESDEKNNNIQLGIEIQNNEEKSRRVRARVQFLIDLTGVVGQDSSEYSTSKTCLILSAASPCLTTDKSVMMSTNNSFSGSKAMEVLHSLMGIPLQPLIHNKIGMKVSNEDCEIDYLNCCLKTVGIDATLKNIFDSFSDGTAVPTNFSSKMILLIVHCLTNKLFQKHKALLFAIVLLINKKLRSQEYTEIKFQAIENHFSALRLLFLRSLPFADARYVFYSMLEESVVDFSKSSDWSYRMVAFCTMFRLLNFYPESNFGQRSARGSNRFENFSFLYFKNFSIKDFYDRIFSLGFNQWRNFLDSILSGDSPFGKRFVLKMVLDLAAAQTKLRLYHENSKSSDVCQEEKYLKQFLTIWQIFDYTIDQFELLFSDGSSELNDFYILVENLSCFFFCPGQMGVSKQKLFSAMRTHKIFRWLTQILISRVKTFQLPSKNNEQEFYYFLRNSESSDSDCNEIFKIIISFHRHCNILDEEDYMRIITFVLASNLHETESCAIPQYLMLVKSSQQSKSRDSLVKTALRLIAMEDMRGFYILYTYFKMRNILPSSSRSSKTNYSGASGERADQGEMLTNSDLVPFCFPLVDPAIEAAVGQIGNRTAKYFELKLRNLRIKYVDGCSEELFNYNRLEFDSICFPHPEEFDKNFKFLEGIIEPDYCNLSIVKQIPTVEPMISKQILEKLTIQGGYVDYSRSTMQVKIVDNKDFMADEKKSPKQLEKYFNMPPTFTPCMFRSVATTYESHFLDRNYREILGLSNENLREASISASLFSVSALLNTGRRLTGSAYKFHFDAESEKLDKKRKDDKNSTEPADICLSIFSYSSSLDVSGQAFTMIDPLRLTRVEIAALSQSITFKKSTRVSCLYIRRKKDNRVIYRLPMKLNSH